MGLFGNLFNSGDRCGTCGRKMKMLSGLFMRTADLKTARTRGCYQCRACGRLTCYDCSDSRRACACGVQQWAERTYIEE